MKIILIPMLTLLGLSLLSSPLLAQGGTPSGPPSFGGRSGGGRFGPPPAPTPEEKEKFRQKLGITVQQQEQMDALFADSDKQRRTLSTRLRELFDQRQTITDVYDFDRSRERALRKETGQVYNTLLKIHYEAEEKLRRILTREQFERLVALRKEMMRSRWEGRGPGFSGKGRPGSGEKDSSGKTRPPNS